MNRIYQTLLHEYLSYFPCVALLGPRQCGKTTLLHALGDNWRFFDLEKTSDFQVIARDPNLFFRLNPQRIGIDEAQFLPEINLILEGEFGLVPVEFKYTQSVGTRDLRAIRDFIAERDCRLGIVVNNDEVARCYDEKLVGMPFACL